MIRPIFVDPKRLRELFLYDQETGIFTRRVFRSSNALEGQVAGCKKSNGRRVIRINGRLEFCNRLAWIYVTGKQPDGEIDHIDGDPENDAFENLRDVSHEQNMQNIRKARSDSKTKVLGVSYDSTRKKYVAQIKVSGKSVLLGRFSSLEEAKTKYVEAKRRYHISQPGIDIEMNNHEAIHGICAEGEGDV